MTKVRSITDIASLYESMKAPKAAEIVEEKVAKFPKGTFPQSTKEVKATTDFESSGPNQALGTSKKKKAKAKKSPKKSGKVVEDSINSFMKSEFDKLFENVMGDDETSFDVNPSVGPEGAAGDSGESFGGEEEVSDEVTITLSKDLAQQLHDVLLGVLGGEEGAGEEDTELEDLGIDLEDEGGSEGEEKLNDATELKELPDATSKMQSKNNKVPGEASKVSSHKADGKVTDKQGNEYQGHPLDKESELTKPGHQKVQTSKTSKPGANLFA
jgi:hypothetical protein